MYCTRNTIEKVFTDLKKQASLMLCKVDGLDITIKEHKKIRSLLQNNSLWALYENILDFWKETGFFIDNLNFRFLTTEIIHEYIKIRFNLKTTTRLSTKEFCQFFDAIQQEWVEQSNGFYEPMLLEDKGYFESTGLEVKDE